MYLGLIDGVDKAFKIILFALDIRIFCTNIIQVSRFFIHSICRLNNICVESSVLFEVIGPEWTRLADYLLQYAL